MRQRIHNLIILDESGSMSSIEKATVAGLNETIQSIKQAQKKHHGQQHTVTLMSFNSQGCKYHYDQTPASMIRLFRGEDYAPNSCTPLFDAIGNGLSRLRRVADDDQVLVTIITDGMENDSHEYDYKAVTSLMDKMKDRGWMITYIGANQDALRVASELHIDNGLEYEASEDGVTEMMALERTSREAFYDCVAECACAPEAKSRIANLDFFGNKKH